MKQLDFYVKTLIPDQFNSLGCPLRPFSLGHIFLMKRFGCSFASENPNQLGGVDDLLLGVAICSRTFEGFLDFINDKKAFNGWSKKWGKQIRKAIKQKKFNLFLEFSNFKKYMKAGVEIPKYWENQESDVSNQSGAHWSQSVFDALLSEYKFSQSEALNVPVANALSHYVKNLEKKGVITLMRDEDLELIEQAKETPCLVQT